MQLGCYSVILLVWGIVGILSCFIVLPANTLRAFAFTALSRVLYVMIDDGVIVNFITTYWNPPWTHTSANHRIPSIAGLESVYILKYSFDRRSKKKFHCSYAGLKSGVCASTGAHFLARRDTSTFVVPTKNYAKSFQCKSKPTGIFFQYGLLKSPYSSSEVVVELRT
jgi:hypothetical protein